MTDNMASPAENKPLVFISYSHKDEDWKDRLKPQLKALEMAGRIMVWDDRKIDAGEKWYPEIKSAMEKSSAAVYLISEHFLSSDFCIKEEIPFLLRRCENDGMLMIPVLISPCAWDVFDWISETQMLPRDGKSVLVDFDGKWAVVFSEVAKLIKEKFEGRTIKAVKPPSKFPPPKNIDITRLPMTGAELFGRKDEMAMLDEAWDKADVRLLSLVAWGGVGKSTLVNKWLERMAQDNYRGAVRVFAWSFYSQGTSERVTSADRFMGEALAWFGDPTPDEGSPWAKADRLAGLIRQVRTLLILDGLEPLQSGLKLERGKIKDPALAALLRDLGRNNPGLCLITTREALPDMGLGHGFKQIDLDRITKEAGRALLRIAGVQGPDAALEEASEAFGNHALALNLLARYLRAIPGHGIDPAFSIPDLPDIPLEKGRHARRMIASFEKRFGESPETELLRILGLFDRPVEKGALTAVLTGDPLPGLTGKLSSLSQGEWQNLLKRLRQTRLIAEESRHCPEEIDCHPLVREHFADLLQTQYAGPHKEAHSRLYAYYKALPEKKYPDTLEEMEPLFAAVAHGCRAGRYQEALDDVYWERISRKEEAYTVKKLGAFGAELAALSGFFDIPWTRPVDGLGAEDKAAVLNWAGFRLRALGRLHEAVQPMQAGLEAQVKNEDWENAASASSSLSELHLTLGQVTEALEYGRQSVAYADQSEEWTQKMIKRTTLAHALYQAGELAQARDLFEEAEAMQREIQPQYPYLYSQRGFQFCDLLLSRGAYGEVEQRAGQTLEWVTRENLLLAIALDTLSLGRAALLKALAHQTPDFNQAETFLNQAVEGLRKAGQQEFIINGLLARAALFRAQGRFDRAQTDLSEAHDIAEQGGMGLFLADIHLESCRLCLAQSQTQEALAHLTSANGMIQRMGYHRRDGEVKELQQAVDGIIK